MTALYFGKLWDRRSRESASRACWELPDGTVVKMLEPTRTLEQNAKEHTIFRDISRQWVFRGQHWDEESVKRLLIDAFVAEMAEQGTPITRPGTLILSIDGKRIVQLGARSSEFTVKEMSLFIEYLIAWAAVEGIELYD